MNDAISSKVRLIKMQLNIVEDWEGEELHKKALFKLINKENIIHIF